MNIRQAMLSAAADSLRLLGDSAGLVKDYFFSLQNPDGGFRGKSASSDLYYTVFGLEGILAVGAEPNTPLAGKYLDGFNNGRGFDLIHLACLARCKADLFGDCVDETFRADIARRFRKYRSADGGFDNRPDAEHGTAYGCFLATGLYEDIAADMPEKVRIVACLKSLQDSDGSYVNYAGSGCGSAVATAAAMVVLHRLGSKIDTRCAKWLIADCFRNGGFCAAPAAPFPDLLSTATVIHALCINGVSIDNIRRQCLEFVLSLQDQNGGFRSCQLDQTTDCEYTYYALLVLGHLSQS